MKVLELITCIACSISLSLKKEAVADYKTRENQKSNLTATVVGTHRSRHL